MMHAFIAGELIRDPEKRTAKNGNDFATALLRCDGDMLVSLSCFDKNLIERLLALKKGDPLSVSGRLLVSAYLDKHGEPRAGLQVTVTEMMSAPARVTKPNGDSKPARQTPRMPGAARGRFKPRPAPGPDLNDPIPF